MILIMKMLSTCSMINMSKCEYRSDGQTMLCVAGDFNAHIEGTNEA